MKNLSRRWEMRNVSGHQGENERQWKNQSEQEH